MRTKLLFLGLLLSSNLLYSQTCVNFQDTTLHIPNVSQTTYGTPFYSKSGIAFKVKYDDHSGYTPPIPDVTIDTSYAYDQYNPNFSGNIMWLGDVDVQIDFTSLSYTNRTITFDASRSYSDNHSIPTSANYFNVNGAGLTTLPAGVVYSYTLLANGIHVQITGPINTVEIQGFENAVDNVCVQQTVTTGVSEINNINDISIYPNPLQNTAYISSEKKIEKIILLNMLGSIVQEDVKPINNQLDLTNLKPGVYFIQAYLGSEVVCKKIIKQNF